MKHNIGQKEFSLGEKSTKSIITIVGKYEALKQLKNTGLMGAQRGAYTWGGGGGMVCSWDSKGFEGSLPKRGDMHEKLMLNCFNDQ